MYHTGAFLEVGQEAFAHIVQCIQQGICSLDPTIPSQAAMALDHLAAFYFQNHTKETAEASLIKHHVGANPDAFPVLLKTVMEVLLTDDCQNQWCLSRPLLPLILINEVHFGQLKTEIAMSHTPEKQQTLMNALDKLMNDVTR